ncbi:putative redox protein Ecym_5216 [Eremothecium cymbalariae DBVPG|uniref:Uncharacterized protein n=1 Tax=Eremothecium cymbalariae (strain CBS 270.75 / DBVPG 7215 / KCTC 17166 / NRRL Y-17582) TaxID=931890 RepID=I6ND43_ERECY|nr:hypothetical protein Ecym_5216 [Eremothecium cymbalariae DBVPG\
MSLLRTLQHQQRVITVFACNAGKIGSSDIMLKLNYEPSYNYKVQVTSTFPTRDQLVYMSRVGHRTLKKQIPTVSELMTESSFNSVFGSTLNECFKRGIWKDSDSCLWVDWEKEKMGLGLVSLRDTLAAAGEE